MNQSLSIVIPAFNEESRLPGTLESVSSYLRGSDWTDKEVLIVDDGSTDSTVSVAERFSASHPCVRVLRNPGNRGKGYAVRHGMLAAQGEWRLFTDADLSAPIDELEKLRQAIERSGAAVAIGSRAIDPTLIGVHQPAFREAAGKLFNATMKVVVNLALADTQCGFKLFSAAAARDSFSRQRLERFGFDVEVLFIADRLGYPIVEVPVRWNHAEGTKVSLWNGAQSFVDLAAIRLNQIRGRYKKI